MAAKYNSHSFVALHLETILEQLHASTIGSTYARWVHDSLQRIATVNRKHALVGTANRRHHCDELREARSLPDGISIHAYRGIRDALEGLPTSQPHVAHTAWVRMTNNPVKYGCVKAPHPDDFRAVVRDTRKLYPGVTHFPRYNSTAAST